MIEVKTPAEQFFDLDGSALDGGFIYVGASGANPETTPVAVYWDKAGTIPATQPIGTVNGYPYRLGAAAKFYTATKNYSITVRNSTGSLVISATNTDSGVFDELADATGAAGIGYDNAVSGLAAGTVQAAIDELKSDADAIDATIDSIVSSNPATLNLFGNSAFLLNSRGYVSATPTTAVNQFTLDLISVVVLGESLAFTASTFGNKITAPAGGAEQIIEGERITGGDYACKWVGSGTIQINGATKTKNQTFTLTAGVDATVRMFGEIEQFMFTRPSMLGQFEYDPLTDIAPGGPRIYNQATVATTSGTAIDITGIPAGIKRLSIRFKDVTHNANDGTKIQIGPSSGVATTGYEGTGGAIVSATAGSIASATSFYIHSAVATHDKSGLLVLELHDASTNTWAASGVVGCTSTAAIFFIGGDVALSGPLERVRITSGAGAATFNGGSVSLSWEF